MLADEQGGKSGQFRHSIIQARPLLYATPIRPLPSLPPASHTPSPIFQCGGAIALAICHLVQPAQLRGTQCVNLTHRSCRPYCSQERTWFLGTMPFNFPATLVPLYALLNPRLLLPSVTVVRAITLIL